MFYKRILIWAIFSWKSAWRLSDDTKEFEKDTYSNQTGNNISPHYRGYADLTGLGHISRPDSLHAWTLRRYWRARARTYNSSAWCRGATLTSRNLPCECLKGCYISDPGAPTINGQKALLISGFTRGPRLSNHRPPLPWSFTARVSFIESNWFSVPVFGTTSSTRRSDQYVANPVAVNAKLVRIFILHVLS